MLNAILISFWNSKFMYIYIFNLIPENSKFMYIYIFNLIPENSKFMYIYIFNLIPENSKFMYIYIFNLIPEKSKFMYIYIFNLIPENSKFMYIYFFNLIPEKVQLDVAPTPWTGIGEHSLKCSASGFPKPQITWYKDGEEIEQGNYRVTDCNLLLKPAVITKHCMTYYQQEYKPSQIIYGVYMIAYPIPK